MKKILIIDDNQDMRENIAEILELANFNVITACDGKEGVMAAQKLAPDLILCDIMMPILDGYGVLEILTNSKQTATIPFIFLTAKVDHSDRRRGMNLGADDYLTKPFEEVDLLTAINSRLKRSQLLKKGEDIEIKDLSSFFNAEHGMESILNLTKQRNAKFFKKDTNIFLTENYPRYVYYLIKGMVKIYKTNDEGRELITEFYKEGDFFGYKALLNNKLYSESAKAVIDCEIRLVLKEDFYELMCNSKDASLTFMQLLASDVLQKKDELLLLAYGSIRCRVATALVKLYHFQDSNHSIFISRDDLSHIVGAANESVIRVLSEFKSDGYIKAKGRKIDVLDIKALTKYCFH